MSLRLKLLFVNIGLYKSACGQSSLELLMKPIGQEAKRPTLTLQSTDDS